MEEFDIPQEFGQSIPEEEQFRVSSEGMESVLNLLREHEVVSTCFVTANFARHRKDLVSRIARSHEIASHGYYHGSFEIGDLKESKRVLDDLTGKEVCGFRRARLEKTDEKKIREAGYGYSSSENPIWLPGRYNHFCDERTVYMSGGLLNIPISASPIVRVPLFWLGIKNFPKWLIKYATWHTLRADGYVNVFFHPWEFADIGRYDLPIYVKRRYGERMLMRLDWYIRWLKERGDFVTIQEFANEKISELTGE